MSEVFAKQLMQLSGVSADRAVAILEKYPTPKRYQKDCHSLKQFFFFILLFTVMHFSLFHEGVYEERVLSDNP